MRLHGPHSQSHVIAKFRANDGEVGGFFAGMPLLLLNTTGAKTGRRRTTPLTYVLDEYRFIVVAADAGNPRHPAWYHNLLAHPDDLTVEVGVQVFAVRAVVLADAERDAAYERFTSIAPQVMLYQSGTTRRFPVLALEPLIEG